LTHLTYAMSLPMCHTDILTYPNPNPNPNPNKDPILEYQIP